MESKLSRVVALALVVLVTAALSGSTAWAAPVPSQTSAGTLEQGDAQAIAAERELVEATLADFGLTEEESASRVDLLTDQEVHTLAADLESVQVAGDQIQWDTTTVLLLLILVVLIAD